MFKAAVLIVTTLTSIGSAYAELTLSETIRPAYKSLVNPAFNRLAIPPTPHNMSLPDFGRGIIGWETGPHGAKTRLENITAADVAHIKTQDVTLEMVQTWQKFYANETLRNPGNPTAPYRAQLMAKIAELW